MLFDSAIDNFADLTQVVEIDEATADSAWEQSQSFSSQSSRWRAYLNRLCASACLPWLQELQAEFVTEELATKATAKVKIWPDYTTLPSFWEVLNGFAITIGITRLVLIPEEWIDKSELRVPKEWVDIQSFAADYYLAVQVNTDSGWIEIWGYASYEKLKKRGKHDLSDRTYCLDEKHLIKDLSVLWVMCQLSLEQATTKSELAVVTESPGSKQGMPLEQANNLLERLGNPEIVFPRLEIPFEQWAALLEHGGWRQRLYERRLGLPEQRLIPQWIKEGISSLAQEMGWRSLDFQPRLSGYRSATRQAAALPVLARDLMIAGQKYQLQVFPEESLETGTWRFRLINLSPGGRIPAGFKLTFFAEDLQPFENNCRTAKTAEEQLEILLEIEPGEGVVWEIEPTPENYEREILRF